MNLKRSRENCVVHGMHVLTFPDVVNGFPPFYRILAIPNADFHSHSTHIKQPQRPSHSTYPGMVESANLHMY